MNRQFGALSGLAMLLIVLNHSIQIGLDYPAKLGFDPLPGWAGTLLSFFQTFGNFAVPVFLFIAGSFIAYAAQGDPPHLTGRFIFTSLRHLLIPYVIWSVIYYAEVFLQRGEYYGAIDYLKNLIVGYPYHFVPLLVFYYLLSPFLARLSRKFAWLLFAVIMVYQLFLLNVIYPGVLGITFPEGAYALTLPVLRNTLADWAIYFPLGLIFGLNARQMLPVLKKYVWPLFILSVGLFVVGLLDAFHVVNFEIARHICPIPLVLVLPAIKREKIPFVQALEKLGKRSYGLYFTHLVVLDLLVFTLKLLVPSILGIPLILFPLLFLAGLLVPLWVMNAFSQGKTRRVYRYVFG